MSVVLEREAVQVPVQDERPTTFRGRVVTPTSLTGELGLNEAESKEWNRFRMEGPDMMYCPSSQMRFADGQQVLLVRYRERGKKDQMQFVKDRSQIPGSWKDFEVLEVFQGSKDPKEVAEWKQLVLGFVRTPPVVHATPSPRLASTATATSKGNSHRSDSSHFVHGKPPRTTVFAGKNLNKK
jgi:hypothetical protein